ncbi:MAG: amidohydrolase [Bacteroidetes bacterium]|nr:MAG: amidohydrolase [Bacteroidota bacterium]REK03371.1 MAG: amidohydrolase [Bacteroidota bacterium]REK34518.1 MAG: amidohydrolase [Bacteroidota bacterium]REK50364.1 MAG: amidohydrolase [Bacteroidota bacterium]
MSALNIALLQSDIAWENPDKNLEAFDQKLDQINSPCDLIILPEMFSTGFTMDARRHAQNMEGNSVSWMRNAARRKDAVICGSLIIEDEGKYYNRLIWMQPNGAHTHYDKRHLFRLAGEEKFYTAGTHQWIMHLKGWNICPLICYDLRFPVWSRRRKDFDYDLLVFVANWPEKRVFAWTQLLAARAIENQCFVAGVNRTGIDGNHHPYTGDSAMHDYTGKKISSFSSFEEKTEVFSLDIQEMKEFRQQLPFLNDADDFKLII